MHWLYLLIAGLLEMGWPVGFKLAQTTNSKVLWIIFAVITMGLSGYLLYIAQKEIPIGIAYSIWTGVGMVGTFFIGIAFFHDVFSVLKLLGICLILAGMIILKICN